MFKDNQKNSSLSNPYLTVDLRELSLRPESFFIFHILMVTKFCRVEIFQSIFQWTEIKTACIYILMLYMPRKIIFFQGIIWLKPFLLFEVSVRQKRDNQIHFSPPSVLRILIFLSPRTTLEKKRKNKNWCHYYLTGQK